MTESKRAKMSDMEDNNIPPVVASCTKFLVRKKRYCKMTANKGSEFCGAHAPPGIVVTAEDAAAERIPCPLDPNHTVFRHKLRKHLTICNAREKVNTLPYIEKDINAGDTLQNPTVQEEYNKIKLHELDDKEFYGIIDKVKLLYAAQVATKTIEEQLFQHESLKEELSQEQYGQETRKHLIQTAALLGILEHHDQLTDDTSFIEFGAGKGQLAFYLATVLESQQLKNAQVVLVDRMSLRHKKDNKVVNKQLVKRIRADIADFKMGQLTELQQTSHNVALSKHLCGAATDLTLRCCVAGKSVEYILIAVCCHHRCDWRSYVGKEWIESAGICPREFVIITKMVSWAVCGTGMSRERRKQLEGINDQEQQQLTQRLTRSEREEIGYMCKRILDYGRLAYLRSCGYEAELKFYVPRDVTLENVVLLARRTRERAIINNNNK